MLNRNEFAAVI